MSRVDDILKYKQNQKISEDNKKIQEEQEKKTLIEQIRLLKPRIDQLLEVGNACRDAQIPMNGQAWGGHEGYDTNQFVTNSWSHLVGFVNRGKNYPMRELGINGGGACGVWNFRTNGVQVYEVHESNMETQAPQIGHMKRFLDKFDDFEKCFYAYVDKVVEKNKDVVPLERSASDSQKPIEVSSNRLSVLAYNAITLLEDNGYSSEDLISELGITTDEYKAIVGKDLFGRDIEGVAPIQADADKKPSLSEKITSASVRTPTERSHPSISKEPEPEI